MTELELDAVRKEQALIEMIELFTTRISCNRHVTVDLVFVMNQWLKSQLALLLPPMKERHGCLGCPMVNGKCPHCGNELMP